MAELSPAALRFGEAMCPAGDSACAERVGAAWERDVLARLGGLASMPPDVQRYNIVDPAGAKVGTMTYVDGFTSLCLDLAGSQQCAQVGAGMDSFDAAVNVLHLMHGWKAVAAS